MLETSNGYSIENDNIKILFTKRNIDAKNSDDVKKVCGQYNFNYDNLVHNTQVHGADVRIIKSPADIISNGLEADGLVTALKDVPLLIFTADCVPLVFFDEAQGVVALAHAGWRGTYNNIAKEIVEIMVSNYGCKEQNIKVIIGPSVSGDSYEVSYDLIEKFSKYNIEDYYKKLGDSYYLDLWKINKGLLLQSGILENNITIVGYCTVKDNDKFFSYRLDNATAKRIGTFIELK